MAGGFSKVIRGMPWAINAFMASPSSAASPSRSSLATASATGGSAATTELTASAALEDEGVIGGSGGDAVDVATVLRAALRKLSRQ